VLAVGCSKKHGVAFDPDSAHPADFITTHPDAFRADLASCADCHGNDLLGGISKVSCYSSSRDGQACHAGGPGGHPAGWLAVHSTTDPAKAATCAPCHKNKSNNLPPNCFNNSLCHGPKSGHPAGWLTSHTGTNPNQASVCARCHQSQAGTPGCFNNTLCHGAKSNHPAGWLQSHTATNPNQAAVCAGCHQSQAGTPGCFNNTLCHGVKDPHPAGWLTAHQSTTQSAATACAACHPEKGIPSCFSVSTCHGSGGGHPVGWSAGNQHGAAAKSAPGSTSGFLYCESCHGSGLNGGSANTTCLNATSSCHSWSAPHANSGWNGGGGRHQSTNVGNVAVCAQCHPVSAPTSGTRCSHNGSPCHGD